MTPSDASRNEVDLFTANFRSTRLLADRAIEQLDDVDLFRSPDPVTNSIAVIMRHIAGNLRSRFTDFLTTDGEKPWRDRDTEFEDPTETRSELLERWSTAWDILSDTLESLTDADLTREVTIRAEPHTVREALLRQASHYGYHVGQIVLMARQFRGDRWQTLSVPKGGSAAYNRELFGRS